MARQVIISDPARSDLREIRAYIGRHNPRRAKTYAHELLSKVEYLAQLPQLGRIVPEFGDEEIRELVHGSYRII